MGFNSGFKGLNKEYGYTSGSWWAVPGRPLPLPLLYFISLPLKPQLMDKVHEAKDLRCEISPSESYRNAIKTIFW